MCKPHTAHRGPYLRQLSDGLHCPSASQWSVWQKSDRHWSGYTSLEQRQNSFIQHITYMKLHITCNFITTPVSAQDLHL